MDATIQGAVGIPYIAWDVGFISVTFWNVRYDRSEEYSCSGYCVVSVFAICHAQRMDVYA
jgi:hypothetical protein